MKNNTKQTLKFIGGIFWIKKLWESQAGGFIK
mgnify:CR=1 FL=1